MPRSKVPLWVVENLFCPYGNTYEKRPETLRKDMKQCEKCGTWIPEFRDEHWFMGNTYCKDCVELVRAEEAKKPGGYTYGRMLPARYMGEVDEDDSTPCYSVSLGEKKLIKDIPRGNLDEQEYRWWIGSLDARKHSAICRVCGTIICGSIDNRTAHWADKRYYDLQGNACTVQFTNAMKVLLKKQKCLVCEGWSTNHKWGVPLCTPACVEIWKFDEKRSYYSLVIELAQNDGVITGDKRNWLGRVMETT